MTGRTRPLDHVPGLAALAQRQLGVVHRSQLHALGVSAAHVAGQLAAQRWSAETPTVLMLMTGAPTREQSFWIAHLHLGPESRLAAHTALEAQGLRGWEREAVHVLIPHGANPRRPSGVVLHQSRRATSAAPVRVDGVPCQDPASAVVLAGSLEPSRRAAAGLVLAAIQQRVTSGQAVLTALGDAHRPRGSAAMRAAASEGEQGADSLAEADAASLLRRAGLGPVRRQVVVRTAEGPRRVDLAVDLPDGTVLVVEVDGVHHADPRQQSQDLAKDAALLAAGCRVLRIAALTVRADPDSVLRQLTALADAARARVDG